MSVSITVERAYAATLILTLLRWRRLRWIMESPDALGDEYPGETSAIMDELDAIATQILGEPAACSPSNAPKAGPDAGR